MAHHPGVTVRHATGCDAPDGGSCSCSPSYRAEVWSQRDGRKIRKTCRTLAAAKTWRADAMREIRLVVSTRSRVQTSKGSSTVPMR